MPKSPESEGSRLITLKQIEQEHGVSRSALHTYRRSASFPRPIPVEGSTKIQYRADQVAAWFEANPPSQGKRTDLAPTQGEAVKSTVTIATPMPDAHARTLAALVQRAGGRLEISLDEMLEAPDHLVVESRESGGIVLRVTSGEDPSDG